MATLFELIRVTGIQPPENDGLTLGRYKLIPLDTQLAKLGGRLSQRRYSK